ncbi:hypothetical protein LX87_01398 [Larkinella arboricola]|uniref:DUF3592 domain-containing protein n=1 Tax=Larkinella arboricola TaxID=643671 RepID=A0A327XGH7_LARAB|nr:hypothetical protein [Larkinella arboricola]RAK03276.1 hypothetical protein LX87_01398 [Larkinella arboricola]
MLQDLFNFLGRLYSLVVTLILIAVIGGATWLMVFFYQEERIQNLFLKEGQLIRVSVADVDFGQRSWLDGVSNACYIRFSYGQKAYETRYVMDSTWVGAGDRVQLLYHPGRDEFRQPHTEPKPDHTVSRLIRWSSANDFIQEYKLLGGVLVLATFLFFLVSGLVVSIFPEFTLIRSIARMVLIVVLGAVAVFFTYDAVAYYRYYQHVKTNGRPLEVTVLATDRHRLGRSTSNTVFRSYRYDATCRFAKGERTIPITEDEYETLKPNDRLAVLYDALLDDSMSATYSGNTGHYILPAFFWFLFLVFLWNLVFKPQKRLS